MKEPIPQTKRKVSAPRPSDLVSLLTDNDECIASLSMEQLLLAGDCKPLIAEHQDTADPLLRRRIHQLSAIVAHQDLLDKAVFEFEQGRLDAWNFALMLDRLYDPKSSRHFLQEIAREFFADFFPRGGVTLEQIADYMRLRKLAVPRPPWLNVGLFLIGDVLENSQGAPILLAILARQLAQMHGALLTICLHGGRVTLMDSNSNILDPMDNWQFTANLPQNQFHLCTNQELIRILLAQLLASSMVAWECFDTHLFFSVIRRLDHLNGQPLPYPFGDFAAPEGAVPTAEPQQ